MFDGLLESWRAPATSEQVSCETLTLLSFRQGAEVRACCATCTFSAEGPTCQLSQPSSHCTSTCFAVTGLKLTSCASAVPNLRPRSCLAALFSLFDQNVPKSVWLLMWTTVHGDPVGGRVGGTPSEGGRAAFGCRFPMPERTCSHVVRPVWKDLECSSMTTWTR